MENGNIDLKVVIVYDRYKKRKEGSCYYVREEILYFEVYDGKLWKESFYFLRIEK